MTYFLDKAKQQIRESIAQALGREIDFNQLEITRPPDSAMGDFAVPCFYLTKLTRISPNQIAAELKNKIKLKAPLKSVQNIGPYLNFYFD